MTKIIRNGIVYDQSGSYPVSMNIASASVLGGIKVGQGLIISADGTLSDTDDEDEEEGE